MCCIKDIQFIYNFFIIVLIKSFPINYRFVINLKGVLLLREKNDNRNRVMSLLKKKKKKKTVNAVYFKEKNSSKKIKTKYNKKN